MPPLLDPLLIFIFLSVQIYLVGSGVLIRTRLWKDIPGNWANPWVQTAFGLATGLAIDACWLMLLGFGGVLTPLWFATGAVLAVLAANGTGQRVFALVRGNPWHFWLITALLFCAIGLHALRAPGHWDDTMYHLPLAREMQRAHALVVAPYLRFPLFPQFMELLFSLGMMLVDGSGGILLAQLLASLPLLIAVLGLIGAAYAYSGLYLPGVLAILLCLSVGPVSSTLGYAYIDDGLLLFCWAAMLALAIAEDGCTKAEAAQRWTALAGAMAGMAIGTKYFGLPIAGLCCLWVLVSRRNWRFFLAFLIPLLAIGGGWYIRAWLISGDPVHPAGGNLFGYYLWDAADLAAQKQEQASHGVDKNLLHVWAALRTANIWQLSLILLIIPFLGRVSRGIKGMFLVIVAYFIFWFFVTQVDRYIVTIVPAAALLSALGLMQTIQWLTPYLNRTLPFFSAITRPTAVQVGRWDLRLLVFASSVLLLQSFHQAQWQRRNWERQLSEREGYVLLRQASASIPLYGPRLLNLGFEGSVYFFDGTAIGDWFGPGRYAQFMQQPDPNATPQEKINIVGPQQLQQLMRNFGVRMVAINTDRFAFDRASYKKNFILIMQDQHGVLLAFNP